MNLRCIRSALLTAILGVVVWGAATPAGAATGPGSGRLHDRRIGVGDATVVVGEHVKGPLITIDGDARVAGRIDGAAVVIRGTLSLASTGVIDGNVFVVRGDARIDGRVNGDVTAIRGRAVVGPTARVRGDVTSSDAPRVARGARVAGDVRRVNLGRILAAIGTGVLIFWWIAVTASTLVLGIVLAAVFPRALDAAAGRGVPWWQAALVGLGLVIGLPIVGVAALGTVVGVPLGFGILGALGLLHAVGYVTGAYVLGRVILKPPRNRFLAFFVGWGILRVAAMVPVLGALVWVAAAVYGVGMLAHAAFRAGRALPAPEGLPA